MMQCSKQSSDPDPHLSPIRTPWTHSSLAAPIASNLTRKPMECLGETSNAAAIRLNIPGPKESIHDAPSTRQRLDCVARNPNSNRPKLAAQSALRLVANAVCSRKPRISQSNQISLPLGIAAARCPEKTGRRRGRSRISLLVSPSFVVCSAC
jgi:hypothetical protein